MLCASAAYNVIGCGLKIATQQLRRVDHGCIYLMIAVRKSRSSAFATPSDADAPSAARFRGQGCYTPFMLGLPEGIISPLFDNDSALIALWVVAVLAALAKVIFARCAGVGAAAACCAAACSCQRAHASRCAAHGV